ncbi:MAG: hypothetical protein IJ334_02715, partial [Clostridia bacterium]|nr:hypothetical protein [Clostridia bacterium]
CKNALPAAPKRPRRRQKQSRPYVPVSRASETTTAAGKREIFKNRRFLKAGIDKGPARGSLSALRAGVPQTMGIVKNKFDKIKIKESRLRET